MQRKTIWIILIIILLAAIGIGGYYFYQRHLHVTMAKEYSQKGYDYLNANKPELAIGELLQALNIIQRNQNTDLMLKADVYRSLAWGYRENNDWKKSLEFELLGNSMLLKMLNIVKSQQSRNIKLNNLYISYTWIMHGCFETNKHDDAIKFFPEIEKLRTIEKPHPELAKIYMGMAKNAQKIKSYDFSNKCCDIGLDMCNSRGYGNFSDVAQKILWVKADNLYRQGHLSDAISLCKEALAKKQSVNESNDDFHVFLQEKLAQWQTEK